MADNEPSYSLAALQCGCGEMGSGMIRTFELLGARSTAWVALLVATSIALTSCSWPWDSRKAAQPTESPEVEVLFPEAPGLKANVVPLETKREMEAALPAGATLHKGVSLSMAGGSFPPSGADVVFKLENPLAEDRAGTIAYWNPDKAEWELRATKISEDRRTLRARVEHFSDYNWIETFYYGIGKALGDKTEPPTCSGGIPSWADPSFSKDNINAPVLWCIGTDSKNPDIMEVRLKMNRPSAGSVTTTIKPAWAWSDLWQNLAPRTWTQMAAQAGTSSNQLGDKYLLQPLGEYRFGFNRANLMDFWHKNPDTPLIQVDSTLTYTLAGLMYQAVADKAAGNMAGVFIMTGLLECGGGLVGAAVDKSVGGAFGAILPCLEDRKDAIAVAAAKAWLKMNPTADWETSISAGKNIGKAIRAAGGWYALVKTTLTAGAIIGDLGLEPILRRVIFRPSNDELRRYLAAIKPQLRTYNDPLMGIQFRYPAEWTSSEPAGSSGTEGPTVANGKGQPIATAVLGNTLDHFQACLPEGMVPYELLSSDPVVIPGMDTTSAPTTIKTELVNIGPTAAQYQTMDKKPVRLQIQLYSTAGYPPGTTKICQTPAYFRHDGEYGFFASNLGFNSVEEAKAYLATKEYGQIKTMLASLRFL